MNVALILCPSWDVERSSCALPLLAASLKERGHEASIFDLNQVFHGLDLFSEGRRDPRKGNLASDWLDERFVRSQIDAHEGYLTSFVDRVLREGHRIVGFSVYFSNLTMSLEVASLFKRRDPAVAVVFGGAQFLKFEHCAEIIARDGGAVDAVVYGEGDVVFPELVEGFARTGRLGAASGVLLKDEPSSWRRDKAAVPDLEGLPFADYGVHRLGPVRVKMINSSRGCVRKCDFCAEWRRMRYRQMSARRIHSELRHQREALPAVRHFMFGDSLVNGVPKVFSRFCDLAVGEPVDATWEAFAIVRPEMTAPVLAKAGRAGCMRLMYGIESGSERVRRRIGKPVSDQLVRSVLEATSGAGINTAICLMAGHPAEDEGDFRATQAFVERCSEDIDFLVINSFQVMEPDDWPAYRLRPVSDAWFWESGDGLNTFPIRLDRVRRLARTAMGAGVTVKFDGSLGCAIERRCDELLERYADWRRTAASAS